MLNKLWNCGVGLREERCRPCVISILSMCKRASTLLQVLGCELGAGGGIRHQIPTILPESPDQAAWQCREGWVWRMMVLYSRGGDSWASLSTHRASWGKGHLRNASPGCASLPLLSDYLPAVTLKPDPCMTSQVWPSTLRARCCFHCPFYTVILTASLGIFAFEATNCQPQDHPPCILQALGIWFEDFSFIAFVPPTCQCSC